MSSQLDLDQGGTFRQTQRIYFGPSIGFVDAPSTVILPITKVGTTQVLLGNTLVTINVNGLVTVQLYAAKGSVAGAIGQPGTFNAVPVTIVDIGGFASVANPMTILPAAGELIDGQASIKIQTPYGAFVLQPNVTSGGWTLQ